MLERNVHMPYTYKFIMEFFDDSYNFKQIKDQLKQGVNDFNQKIKVGQIIDFAVVPKGVVVVYECKRQLEKPGCALSHLSRIWNNSIPGFSEHIKEKRIFREVESIPID